MTCFLHSNYWQSKMLYWLSANYDAFLYGVAKNTFRYRSCPQTHKQMNRLMADNQADGLSGKLKGRFMARKRKTGKRTGKRGQRETGMGRQTDGQTVWTDRQMVILLGKVGSDEMDKQAIRLADGHTNRQELYWDAINGRTKKWTGLTFWYRNGAGMPGARRREVAVSL